MKRIAKKFKSLQLCLTELERFVRDPEHLQTGKPFEQLDGLRPREVLANLLLCIVLNSEYGCEDYTFTSDPEGGDGILYNQSTKVGQPTEHVFVPKLDSSSSDTKKLILAAIEHKQTKGGAAYASGKVLIIFSNAPGEQWFPNTIAKEIFGMLDFVEAWAIALQKVENGDYVYGLTQLKLVEGHAPVWIVRIKADFQSWQVERIQ